MNAESRKDAPVGVVVVTHTDYGSRLIAAAEFILGPQPCCQAVSVDLTKAVDESLAALKAAIKDTDQGGGVLVLTDMFGGTPSNLAISVMNGNGIEVIAGVNLPMLIKLAGIRGENNMEKALIDASEAGRKYINVASRVLSGK